MTRETLPELLDRKALKARGLTRVSIDVIFNRLPVVQYPGSRKVYVKATDVAEFEAAHTYDGRTKVRVR